MSGCKPSCLAHISAPSQPIATAMRSQMSQNLISSFWAFASTLILGQAPSLPRFGFKAMVGDSATDASIRGGHKRHLVQKTAVVSEENSLQFLFIPLMILCESINNICGNVQSIKESTSHCSYFNSKATLRTTWYSSTLPSSPI